MQHPAVFIGASPLPFQADVRGQSPAKDFFPISKAPRFGHPDQNTVQPPTLAQVLHGERNIHHHGTPLLRGTGTLLEDAAHRVSAHTVIEHQSDCVPRFAAQVSAQPDGIGSIECVRICRTACGLDRISNHIHGDQGNGVTGVHKQGGVFEARPNMQKIRKRGEAREHTVRYSPNGGNFEVGIARQGFDGRPE